MFRRSSSTATTSSSVAGSHRRRAVRRARQREVVDDAALRARLDRMNRRLAEVSSVQVTARAQGIDNDAARRDPLTRPFSAPAPRVARSTSPFAAARTA
jgi:hypothetical protein